MRLLTIAALLAATVLLAQETPAPNIPEPSPERQKALKDALRHLYLVPPARPVQKTPVPGANTARADVWCAHIRIVPADPEIDPKMLLPVEPPKSGDERTSMPIYEGLPPCEVPARSAPRKP